MPVAPQHPRASPLGAAAKVTALTLAAGAAALLPILLFMMGPKFDEIYSEFGVRIPPLTGAFLALGRLLVSVGLIGALAVAVLLPAAVIGLGRVGWRSPVLITLLTLVCCGVFVAFMVSMYAPLIEMIEALNASPAPTPAP